MILIALEFLLEFPRGVQSHLFRLFDLQFKVDEEVHIVLEGLQGYRAVLVVLEIDGLELAFGDLIIPNFKDRALSVLLGLDRADQENEKKGAASGF